MTLTQDLRKRIAEAKEGNKMIWLWAEDCSDCFSCNNDSDNIVNLCPYHDDIFQKGLITIKDYEQALALLETAIQEMEKEITSRNIYNDASVIEDLFLLGILHKIIGEVGK